jgi:hypothetical protein
MLAEQTPFMSIIEILMDCFKTSTINEAEHVTAHAG